MSKRQAINSSENIVGGGATNNLSPQSLIQSGSPLIGKPAAPITIVEFGDFQCKFCDRFAKETEPKINATYFQTGKVNMIVKNFVIYGSDSPQLPWQLSVQMTKASFGIL